jgi:prefoldin subunit 5
MTYTHGHYTVLLSQNEQSIFIKLTDTVNFMCYEGNLESSDFPKNYSLVENFTILQKCFEALNDYSVTLSTMTGNLKLQVKALVGGFVRVDFAIFVKEKILSNDGQLTLNFNRMEQKQDHAVQNLAKRCEALDNRCKTLETALAKQSEDFFKVIDRLDVLLFSPCPHRISCQSQFPIAMPKLSCEELFIQNAHQFGQMRLENLSIFYKLKKLKIHNFVSITHLSLLSNETVTELELNCASNGSFTSLEGFKNFPSLTTLTVITAPGLTNVVQSLKSAPHKIKTLKFQGCAAINVVELQTYCQENKIFVALS